jgi:hypothetical protein
MCPSFAFAEGYPQQAGSRFTYLNPGQKPDRKQEKSYENRK